MLQILQAALDAIEQRKSTVILLDNMPLSAAVRFANLEDSRPFHRALTNQRLIVYTVVLLEGHQLRTIGIFP